MATIPVHTPLIRQRGPELAKPFSRVLYAERLKIHSFYMQAISCILFRRELRWRCIADPLNL
jgi:hypothetical protein